MPRAKAAVVGAADSTGRCETGSKRSRASETAAETDSSPAKRKPKARGKSPSPRSTTAKAKIKWSCLLDHGDSVPGVLQCDDDGGGDAASWQVDELLVDGQAGLAPLRQVTFEVVLTSPQAAQRMSFQLAVHEGLATICGGNPPWHIES